MTKSSSFPTGTFLMTIYISIMYMSRLAALAAMITRGQERPRSMESFMARAMAP